MNEPFEEDHTFGVFVSDVKKALSAWRMAPWLPIITAGLALIVGLGGILQALIVGEPCPPGQCTYEEIRNQLGLRLLVSSLSLLVIPVALFQLGWNGTERIWYLRNFRGLSISKREAWDFSWSFVGRFLVLGMLLALVLVPVSLSAFGSVFSSMRSEPGPPNFESIRFWPVLISTAAFVVVEFGLTFVTPALAYSTRRVSEALRIGLRMIKDTWPKSALYVLVPPLSVSLVARFLPVTVLGVAPQALLLPITALANLAFKGATAAFYLRRVDVGENGAAGKEPTATV